MLHVFWALLNLGLFIWFFSLCMRAFKLMREDAGLGVALFFVAGLFSIAFGSVKQTSVSKSIDEWTFNTCDSLTNTRITEVMLNKTTTAAHYLNIYYGVSTDSGLPEVSRAKLIHVGFSDGTSWRPISVNVTTNSTRTQLQYSLSGTVNWSLLGLRVWTEAVQYDGLVDIK